MKEIDLTKPASQFHESAVVVSIPPGTEKPIAALREQLWQAMKKDAFLIISVIRMHPAIWSLVRSDPDIKYHLCGLGGPAKFDDTLLEFDKSLPL